MKKLLNIIFLSAVFLGQAKAQGTTPNTPAGWDDLMSLLYVVLGFVLVLSILVILVASYMLQIVNQLKKELVARYVTGDNPRPKEAPGFFSQLNQWLTNSTPVEEESTILLDHNYDGIQELDNHLPPWWKALLYGSMVWAVGYLFMYHVSSSLPLSIEEYENELAYADEQMKALEKAGSAGKKIDENTVEIITDKASLADGKKTFGSICASCHRPDGGGDIGPNLTDAYWKHGGSIKNIFSVIYNGVPSTNMISWASSMSPEKIQNVANYILTLQGTLPPNAKKPEGELYNPEASTSEEVGDI